jgi:hypothetical protein
MRDHPQRLRVLRRGFQGHPASVVPHYRLLLAPLAEAAAC